jgi:acyl-CoA thioester hydrolase
MPDALPVAGDLSLHKAVVRPEWVDYNGHMSECYYVLIFGDATDAFYDHVGMDDAYRRREKISLYTLEAHIRYLIEAHEGQYLRIATRVMSNDTKRLRLHHTMLDDDSRVLAVTEITALHVDTSVPKGCDFHAEPLARIAAIAEAQKGLTVPVAAMTRHWIAP